MPVDTAISAWQSLKRLAGQAASVHITGGEPFLYFDRLAEILSTAHREKLTPLDQLETNASWATDENDIREKLDFLDKNGLKTLKISWDPFHAEFVSADNISRLKSISEKMLGDNRVLVRWAHWLDNPPDMASMTQQQKNELFAVALRKDPCRFTGRAEQALAPLAVQKPLGDIAHLNCLDSILNAKGVHIDPFGNVFVGQCSGIIAGNICCAGLDELWKNFNPADKDIWKTLAASGPAGLVPIAQEAGYLPLVAYAGKCHICAALRRFFFDKQIFSQIIGPSECYRDSI